MKDLNSINLMMFFSIIQDIQRNYEIGWNMIAKLLIYYMNDMQRNIPYNQNEEYSRLVKKMKELKKEEEAYWNKKKSQYNF
jgi:hypothetical protein